MLHLVTLDAAAGGPVSHPVSPASPAAAVPAPGWFRWAAAALLAAYAVMAWTAAWHKGVSFDEGLQLAVGYNIWRNHDHRLEGANGDFVKRWATLPYLVSKPRLPASLPSRANGYDLGDQFLFQLGNNPESLLRQARAMMALLGVAAGWLVFHCARVVHGPRAALLSLALFAFSPGMLAFGGVVSTDLSITLTLFATTWCVWGLLHEVTRRRLLASLAACTLMVLAKATALVILPITVVMVAVRLARGGPLVLRWGASSRALAGRRGQLAVIFVLFVLHLVVAWGGIWAHYGFRYAASPAPGAPALAPIASSPTDPVPAALARLLGWVERGRVLPEGFHRGIEWLLHTDDAVGSFMHGTWKVGGRALFFPYAIWVKTPPALLGLLVMAALANWQLRSSRHAIAARPPESGGHPVGLYALTPFLALIGCYLGIAMTEDLNIGHRHVLPLYPALYVLAGAAVLWRPGRAVWTRGLVAAALAWLVIDSLSVRPHYLSYFGPQAGGPRKGYRHLVDSSLDWGMDLPFLRGWLDEHDPARRENLFLAYFGNDRPKHYGIEARRLPGFFDRREAAPYALAPGYYAISATLFQGVYTAAFGPWNRKYEELYQSLLKKTLLFQQASGDPQRRAAFFRGTPPRRWFTEWHLFDDLRFARLCAWLRHRGAPPQEVGHSILLWKLDSAALQAAILGPPPELANSNPVIRQYRLADPAR